MSLDALFYIAILLGFIFWFLATWPVTYAERIARGFFLVAAIIFVAPKLGLG